MSENPDRIERTLELLLYAPIGIGMFLKDTAPNFVDMFVSRGRAEVDRRQDDVQQRVTTARSLGQVAMAFGPPVIREKVETTVANAWHHAEELFGTATGNSSTVATPPAEAHASPAPADEGVVPAPAEPIVLTDAAPEVKPAGAATNGDLSRSADLPIPGYDALSASQVVERLMGLAPDELDAVHAYETAHRGRRTILGKIEQLAG